MCRTVSPGMRKLLRAAVALCLFLMLFVWLPLSHRPFSFLLGVCIVGAWWLGRLRGRRVAWVFVWCAVSTSPVELGLRNVPGPPRLVPFTDGTPSALGRERNARGDVAWGGCMRSGFGPKWVVVW
jgi:hypothetical protein